MDLVGDKVLSCHAEIVFEFLFFLTSVTYFPIGLPRNIEKVYMYL